MTLTSQPPLYALLGKLVLDFATFGNSITVIWLPGGLGVVALLLGSKKYYPAVFFGAFAVGVLAGHPIWVAALAALGNILESLFVTGLLRHNPNKLAETLSRWIVGKSLNAQQPQKSAQIVSNDNLPDSLPLYDIPVALARIGGKSQLLRKLILMFSRNYANAAQDLDRLFAEGRHQAAAILAYKLKSVASN